MNPKIPGDYHETARWLGGFVRSHAKRESSRIEVVVDDTGPREGHSFGTRLILGGRLEPPAGEPPIELAFDEVAEGRSQLAWCAALAARIRGRARHLADAVKPTR